MRIRMACHWVVEVNNNGSVLFYYLSAEPTILLIVLLWHGLFLLLLFLIGTPRRTRRPAISKFKVVVKPIAWSCGNPVFRSSCYRILPDTAELEHSHTIAFYRTQQN